ncbi:MAG: SRPBCC domain-containing protein [Flavobacteriales bacterium]|nr:SRPBCC domain-containing protein [Flavobacteriales bacterium]MBP6574740.1 SRPBCC domain-containing protein [Flavobacteriales bacterium]
MSTQTATMSDTVRITRTFNAPVKAIWQAWTEAGKARQWWGPNDYTCPVANMDVRLGGKSLMAMEDKDGKRIWSTATYSEVEPMRRLVFQDRFSDSQGNAITPNEAGMPGDWPKDQVVTVTLEEKNGRTEMDLTHTGFPPEVVDDCTKGWNESFDKLASSLEK